MPPRSTTPQEPSDLEASLAALHHAAFELRETDPSEAVKLLRRLVKQGGDVEGLAHGALGEILLDVFDDVDGALHHFRRLVTLAPALPAGHHGLARALVVQGDLDGARRAFLTAAGGLVSMLDEALALPADERPPGLEEGLLMLYGIGDELRAVGGEPPTVDGRFTSWAESERLFDAVKDDPEDEDDLDDWMRYGAAMVSEETRVRDLDAGLAASGRLALLVPLDERREAVLRSHAFEVSGRFGEAATAALAGVGDLEGAFEYEEVARAAALLDRAGRGGEAKGLLTRLEARLRREFSDVEDDEEREALEALLATVHEMAADTGPRLVSLGGPVRR